MTTVATSQKHYYSKRFRTRSFHKKHGFADNIKVRSEVDPALKSIFTKIGRPEEKPFIADPFQLEALEAIKKHDCVVIAPTGAGKTWIAEQATLYFFNAGKRSWYASPLKALTNAKWVEFGNYFESKNVGILTGDTKENADAPIIVGTTEILRNQLYDAMHRGENFNCDLVVLDEAHFLGDADRGVVWEEVMIYLPPRINLLLLSATIGNGEEIARWISSIRSKPCVVVREEKRPVPLYPLFFHPSGKVMPLLEKADLHGKVKACLEEAPHFRRGRQHHFGNIISALEKFQLLPAIFFLKSRAECDAALKTCHATGCDAEDDAFNCTLQELLSRFPFLEKHKQLRYVKSSRVAAHHGGQLPAWKFFIETMMKRGHLKAIFATTTVAAGVNFPARTIVLFNSDIFNGREFSPLTSIEFHQMTGRAGRRGQDKIGFMLLLPGRFMDVRHIKRLLFRKSEEISGQLRSDFSMVLNLLLSQTPEDIKGIFDMSFTVFQQHLNKVEIPFHEPRPLWEDFCRHMDLLIEEGFVDKNGRPTDTGAWASKLRLDQPLLIAECLKREAFPKSDAKLFAAVVAPFVYDGDQSIKIIHKKTPGELRHAVDRVLQSVKPLIERMKTAGFEVHPIYQWPAAVMYYWAGGADWDELVHEFGIADGDLAALVLRTADNLRQIMSLKETHPVMAELAMQAREAIFREPVVFE